MTRRTIAYAVLATLLVVFIAARIGGVIGYHQAAQRQAAFNGLLSEYNHHCEDLNRMFIRSEATQRIQDVQVHGEEAARLGSSYAQAPAGERAEIVNKFLDEIRIELTNFNELQKLMRPHVVAANRVSDLLRSMDPNQFEKNREAMKKTLNEALKPLSVLDGIFGSANAVVGIKTQALNQYMEAHDGKPDGFDDNAEMIKAATAVLDATVAPAPKSNEVMPLKRKGTDK